MNTEEALDYLQQILTSPGPEDWDPDEFAAQWVVDAYADDFPALIQFAQDPAIRELGFEGRAWGLIAVETIIDAWAAYDARKVLGGFSPLLGHPVGRRAALFALEAATRYDRSTMTAVLEALKGLPLPLSAEDKADLSGILWRVGDEQRAELMGRFGIDSLKD